VARLVLGVQFDPTDLLWYLPGTVPLVVVHELLSRSRRTSKEQSEFPHLRGAAIYHVTYNVVAEESPSEDPKSTLTVFSLTATYSAVFRVERHEQMLADDLEALERSAY
jgi:hypothetical protein